MSTILQGRPGPTVIYKIGLSFRQNESLTFDNDVSIFTKSRALHGEGEGGTSVGLDDSKSDQKNSVKRGTNVLKIILMLIFGHCDIEKEVRSKRKRGRMVGERMVGDSKISQSISVSVGISAHSHFIATSKVTMYSEQRL